MNPNRMQMRRSLFDGIARAKKARLAQVAQSNALDSKANAYYTLGEEAGSNADGYVRTTVYLATVLFLVGISGHFKVRAARMGLISVAGVILVFSCVSLIIAPKPPV